MAAFLVVDTAIENSDEYEKYKILAKPITEQYGGFYRARGANMGVVPPVNTIVLKFLTIFGNG